MKKKKNRLLLLTEKTLMQLVREHEELVQPSC